MLRKTIKAGKKWLFIKLFNDLVVPGFGLNNTGVLF